ncbi:unnamed protein product, partial [Symbiodinium sp. CCMP2456]
MGSLPGAKVKLKWDYDRTEAELESWDVQKKESAQEAQEVVEFSAGDKVEAKYGSSFYDAEVLSMSMEDGKVKLKWGHDGSEAEVDASEVKLKPDSQEKEAAPPAELKEGDKVEAKYGDSFHDAEVVTPETEDGKVKVKWGFDGSEADVDPSEVKVKPEEPPEPPEKLLVIGFLRPRLEVELRTMNRIEAKAPGHCLANPRASDEGPGVGIGIMELTPSDGTLAKLIGKGGAMKMKIASISGCSFEYMAKDSETKQAWILGTAEERARRDCPLSLRQHSVDFRTRAQELPAALQDWSSSFTVSGNAGRGLNASFGMQTIEDSTETFIFTLSKPSGPASVVKRDIVKDSAQECKSKGEWLEATVLEVSTWSTESDDEVFACKAKVFNVKAFNVREHLNADEALERERQAQRASAKELIIISSQAEKRREATLLLAASLEAKFPGCFSAGELETPEGIAVSALAGDMSALTGK